MRLELRLGDRSSEDGAPEHARLIRSPSVVFSTRVVAPV